MGFYALILLTGIGWEGTARKDKMSTQATGSRLKQTALKSRNIIVCSLLRTDVPHLSGGKATCVLLRRFLSPNLPVASSCAAESETARKLTARTCGNTWHCGLLALPSCIVHANVNAYRADKPTGLLKFQPCAVNLPAAPSLQRSRL